jgi:hypothetical protein
VSSPHARGPQPRLLVVALFAAGGYVVATREPAPDRRAVVLPVFLAGLPGASSSNSADYRQQMEQSVADWWPDRSAAFGLYASDNARPARYRDLAGPHVFVVRGRFGDKGDAHMSERRAELGRTKGVEMVAMQKRQIGPNTCEWTELISVCWRETDRLSVSVLTMDRSDASRVSGHVDEIWDAVR